MSTDPSLHYTTRESTRARRVFLRISARGALEVVVPAGFDRTRVAAIVRDRKPWIEKTLQRLRRSGRIRQEPDLPHSIDLRALRTEISVSLCPGGRPGFVETNGTLLLTADSSRSQEGRKVLHQWLLAKGKDCLIPWLEHLARQTGHTYKSAQVRRQKTRWGSCSARGTISLNCKLLFLPEEMVRLILLHELCHTVVPNHSPRFWNRLESFFPSARNTDRQLSQGWKYVPLWAEED